jgi:hypothetical protein
VAATQDALSRSIDRAPRRADDPWPGPSRHVHRLHPFLGALDSQLVDVLLGRHVPLGSRVLDPFAGSGTTLVQSLESGHDSAGVDIAGFNALLARVKTRPYNLEALRRDILFAHAAASEFVPRGCYPASAGAYVRGQFAPTAAEELLHFRTLVEQVAHGDVLRVVLARAAHTARQTTTRPVVDARHLLLRYTLDALGRIETFAAARAEGRIAEVMHGDARRLDLRGPYGGVVTSPPYPALIDYHEQHRHAYELLGLEQRRDAELGRPALGTGRRSIADYVDGIAAVFRNVRTSLALGARVCIVVDDRRSLYPEILRRAGLRLEDRSESILVAVAN